MRGQKDLRTMKKVSTRSKIKLSLELNVIETKQFFLQKEGVSKTELGIKNDPMGSENAKRGQCWVSSQPVSSMIVPPAGVGNLSPN